MQVRLLMVAPVGQTKHLKLGPMMLPAGQTQAVPVQEKVVSIQLQVVAFSLFTA